MACLSIEKQNTFNIGRTLILQQARYMATIQDNKSCYQHTSSKSYNSTSENTSQQINHKLIKLRTYFRNLLPNYNPNSTIYHRFTDSVLILHFWLLIFHLMTWVKTSSKVGVIPLNPADMRGNCTPHQFAPNSFKIRTL